MKKALVILLTLAVAGGLFAQTFTLVGNFEGGIGMLGGEDFDDPVFGVVAPHTGVNGARGQLTFDARNAAGNAGFQGRLRATGFNNAFAAGAANGLHMQQAWGWIRLFDNILELRAGRYWDGVLVTQTPGGVDASLFDNTGLVAYLRPTDMFTLGFGAFSPVQGGTWEESGLRLWAGLGLNLGDIEVRGHLTIGEEHLNALVGLRVSLLDGIPIHAQLRMENLHEFGDIGLLYAHFFVGLNNLVDNLGITLGAALAMSSVDDTDLSMAFGGWLTYNMGLMIPRLDLWYVMGGNYNYGAGFANNATITNDRFDFDSDNQYFSIRPRLDFQVAANQVWTVGCLFNLGLGDNEGVNWGFFTGVRVQF